MYLQDLTLKGACQSESMSDCCILALPNESVHTYIMYTCATPEVAYSLHHMKPCYTHIIYTCATHTVAYPLYQTALSTHT